MREKRMFDSNILIRLFNNKSEWNKFIMRFKPYKWLISEITEIEVLSKPGLSPEEEAEIKGVFKKCKIIRFSQKIKRRVIPLRRCTRLKLPDAIIAATALLLDVPLVSNDTELRKAASAGLIVEDFP